MKHRALLAYSPFARGELSGHSIVDDIFFFQTISARHAIHNYSTSDYAIERIKAVSSKHQGLKSFVPHSLHLIDLVKYVAAMPLRLKATVIFFGYTEKLILIYLILSFYSPQKLILVSTNNFSLRRFSNFKKTLKAFLFLVEPRILRLVVHTDREKERVVELCPKLRSRVTIKKHHLMIPLEDELNNEVKNQKRLIAFFGPGKSEKPFKDFLSLVDFDKNHSNNYVVFGASADDVDQLKTVSDVSNVEVLTGWLSEEAYQRVLSRVDVIMLTHNLEFDGKLSGNLCDAVARRIPVISQKLSPVTEYSERYGSIAYYYDPKVVGWEASLLKNLSKDNDKLMTTNLEDVSTYYTRQAVEKSLLDALGPL